MENIRKIAIALALLLLAPSVSIASIINDKEAVETVAIFVRDVKIFHQWEWRNLSVSLEYGAEIDAKAPDIYALKDFVRVFFEQYSNPDDFWEIMNTNLVSAVSEAFPEIVSIKSTLSLAPDLTLRSPRASIVEYEKGNEILKESFSFTKLNYYICQETFRALNFYVVWSMKDNPNPQTDYPDYQWIDAEIEAFFTAHPVSFSKWNDLKPKLQAYLLERFPALSSIDTEIKVVE